MQKIKRIIAACIALAIVFACCVTVVATESGNGEIVIYHTNDVHGAVAWSEDSSIGLDRVAAMKKQTENAILVDAGDATQGLPFASLTYGLDVIDVMNVAGYDVMAAGNHEFDFGTENLLSNAAHAEFPILAANVYMNGNPLLEDEDHDGCHVIIERDGKKIGFFGLTTVDTATSTNPAGIVGVEFKDEIETAKREIDKLEAAGVDAIIAIAHLGEYTNVSCDSAKLAEAMTGEYADKLDAIIDGHSHTKETKEVNGILIMQTGTGLNHLGKITLDFGDDNELDKVSGELLSYDQVMELTDPDADVKAKIEATTEAMMGILSVPVVENEITLWGGTVDGVAEARVVETNLGSFVADAYRDAAERFIEQAAGMDAYQNIPVIGVENGGGIRTSLPYGTITMGDLVSAFPFSNTLMVKQITPQILFEMLESSVSSIFGQDTQTGLLSGEPSGGFLQVSGIRFTYNPGAPVGEKVLEVVLEETGEVLDRTDADTKLMLVSNNFIMNGGSGHEVLAGLPLVGEIGGELETVNDYLTAQAGGATLKAQKVRGRIVPAGGYAPMDYTASIRIENEDGSPAADTSVTYYLDNGEAMEGKTDGEGILRITVSDGPHNVRLGTEQKKEVYINNYTGAGTVETDYRGYPVLKVQAATEQPSEESDGADEQTTPVPDEQTTPVPDEQTAPVPDEQTAPVSDEQTAPVPDEPSFMWVWIVVGAVVIAGVAVLIVKLKKKTS